MRLWSLHPKYLDARGLVALWREGLLAQAVLMARTQGYRHHPQLERFRNQHSPLGAIAGYLLAVHAESRTRGYSFDTAKINRARSSDLITVTRGQLIYEWGHLLAKLAIRDPLLHNRLAALRSPKPPPLFRVVAGDVESWEKRQRPLPDQGLPNPQQ